MAQITVHALADTNTTWTIDTSQIAAMVGNDYHIGCYDCGSNDLSYGLYVAGLAGLNQRAVCAICAYRYSPTPKRIPTDAELQKS